MKTAALIPAAGNGFRLGEGPKALLKLGNKTLLEILVHKIKPLVDEVVIAAPNAYQEQFQALAGNDVKIIAGGGERKESIEKLIASTHADVLLIQNVASPFASIKLLQTVLQAAINDGAAGAFYAPTVPIAKIDSGNVTDYWNRTDAGYFQTPQACHREILLSAHQKAGSTHYQSTLQYVIEAGFTVTTVPGEEENIKITSDLDWQIAQYVLAPRLGIGADQAPSDQETL